MNYQIFLKEGENILQKDNFQNDEIIKFRTIF